MKLVLYEHPAGVPIHPGLLREEGAAPITQGWVHSRPATWKRLRLSASTAWL